MEKILFCYFSQNTLKHYVPLDLGYLLAEMGEKRSYDVEIIELSHTYPTKEENNNALNGDFNLIKFHKPTAIFFFLDNILWSGAYALGRAEKVAIIVRDRLPKVFLGMQSYKIQEKDIRRLLFSGAVDAIVKNNPGKSFVRLLDILKKKKVSGVTYYDGANKKFLDYLEESISEDNLDYFPSPYLSGILDNIVAKKQIDNRGKFECFLYSMFGCPFKCYYCFRSVKYDKPRFFSVQRFFDEIEYLFNYFGIIHFFILDDSFLSNKSRQQEFINEFKKRKDGNPKLANIRLRAMIRPELIDKQAVELLKSINIRWVQIGLQTVNPSLNKYISRALAMEGFKNIAEWFQGQEIRLQIDVIIGLPDDTIEYLKKTLDYALELNPFAIQVKQFYLNPDTVFFNNQQKYEIKIADEQRELGAPFVVRARGGIDENYIKEATDYVVEKIKQNPSIKWTLVTMFKHFSSNYHKKL